MHPGGVVGQAVGLVVGGQPRALHMADECLVLPHGVPAREQHAGDGDEESQDLRRTWAGAAETTGVGIGKPGREGGEGRLLSPSAKGHEFASA